MDREQMILWILEIIAFMVGLYAVQIPLRKKNRCDWILLVGMSTGHSDPLRPEPLKIYKVPK